MNRVAEWQETTLGAVASEITVGHVGPMASEYVADGVPFLRSQNVLPLRINRNDLKFIPPEFHRKLRKSALSPGDVVIVRTGKPGAACVIPEDLTSANCSDLVIVRPGDRVDPDFLAYYVNTAAAHHVNSHLVGAVQQHFNVGAARAMRLRLPRIEEQRRIAGILRPLDDKIEQNRRTARALERLARAIFRAWFVDFEPVKAKAAGAASFPSMPQAAFDALLTRLVDAAIGPVPEGWEVKALGDICEINARSVRKGEIDGEIEYVDIASVSVGQLDEVQRVPFAEAPSRARRRIKHGDTIWSCVRPNRRSYLFIHSPSSERIVSTGFAVLSPTEVGPAFLYQTVTQTEFVDYLVSNADGSAYPAVRADHFAAAEVLVPPGPLVDAFDELAMPMRDWIAQADTESRTLAELRDLLLPKLLSGAVRVGEASVEVIV